ncbi:hypothetical protein SAMN00790413_04396 [Deinococcus hopiensis KR-140]|uniref:Uncharacterized protein n=1 Tax=Deinococcus hopiensis KR-140 TaxID=695939 RepID=A0A1W1UQJ8_9DEIO|nr:hypothetical protein SAMN00790413_04396 [Deinococcus hopiensis KR-140]
MTRSAKGKGLEAALELARRFAGKLAHLSKDEDVRKASIHTVQAISDLLKAIRKASAK